MAFTQADLDAINAAIASAASVVQQADKRYESRSMDDLLKAKDIIEGELATATNTVHNRTSIAAVSMD